MVTYKYTDYSNVRPDPKALPVLYADGLPSSLSLTALNAGVNQNGSSAGVEEVNRNYILRDIRKQVLPVKLNLMLSDPKFSHIISWMPHGRAWRVFRPKEFTEFVAPIYFEYPNYNSFIRLVNAWGFRRVTTGVDTNAYYHELFLRDMPHLHKMMRRLSKNEKKTPLDSKEEPDFYKMPSLTRESTPPSSAEIDSMAIKHSSRAIDRYNQQAARLFRNPQVQAQGVLMSNDSQGSGLMLRSSAPELQIQPNLSSSTTSNLPYRSVLNMNGLPISIDGLPAANEPKVLLLNNLVNPTLLPHISVAPENIIANHPQLVRLPQTAANAQFLSLAQGPATTAQSSYPQLAQLKAQLEYQQKKEHEEKQSQQLLILNALQQQAQNESLHRVQIEHQHQQLKDLESYRLMMANAGQNSVSSINERIHPNNPSLPTSTDIRMLRFAP